MNAACAATGACLLDVGPATDADAGLHQNCANQLVWVVLWVYTSTTSERARGGPKVCYSVLLSRLSPPPMTSPGAALSTDKLSFARPLRAKPSSAIDSHGKTRPRAACQTALSAFPENVRKPPKRGASTRESGQPRKRPAANGFPLIKKTKPVYYVAGYLCFCCFGSLICECGRQPRIDLRSWVWDRKSVTGADPVVFTLAHVAMRIVSTPKMVASPVL